MRPGALQKRVEMRAIPQIVVLVVNILLFSNISLASSSNEDVVFRDTERKFIFQYPKDWQKVPSTHERTRIKIVSDNGDGEQDCSVNVREDKNITSPKDFVKDTNFKAIENGLKKAYEDAKIIQSGSTFISSQEAIYYVANFTVKSVSVEIPFSAYVIQTSRNGYIYTIGCRSTSDEFLSRTKEFEKIFFGFLITQ